MAISSVGSPFATSGAVTTLAVSPTAIGDVLVFFVTAKGSASTISAVSGGGVTTWSKLQQVVGTGTTGGFTPGDQEIWYGTITATGAATISLTVPGGWANGVDFVAQQFTAGSAAVWSADGSGASANAGSVFQTNYPSLTPSGTSELWLGRAGVGSNGSTFTTGVNATSGFTYYQQSTNISGAQACWNTAASSPTAQAPILQADGNYYAAVCGMLVASLPPPAPTLTFPATAAYADLTGTPTFSWAYTGTGPQTAWAMRRKIGAGAYAYWSVAAGNWSSSTPVWNTGSIVSFAFPSAQWAYNTTYNWSVNTQNAAGTGTFATDFVVTCQAAPVCTVSAPTGSVASTLPVVNWSATFGGSAVQTAYQVRTFSAAQYGGGGFNPPTSPAADDSGVVGSAATTYQVGTALTIGAYRSYVFVTETGGQISAASGTSFTVGVDEPPSPALTAVASTDAVTGAPTIALTALAQLNLLTAPDSSFETGTGLGNLIGCTEAISATKALDGSFSMRLTATATAMSSTSVMYAVVANQQYTAMASLIAAATARNWTVALNWYGGVGPSFISTSTSAAVADNTSTWTQPTVTATAPPTATFATITIGTAVTVSSEVHYVDCVGLFIGTASTWTAGGMTQTGASVVITRSDGLYVRNASAANPLALTALAAGATVSDYEAVPGVAYTYTAIVQVGSGTGYLVSAPCAPTAAVTLVTTAFWVMDPTAVAGATQAIVLAITTTQDELSAAHMPIGQTGTLVSPVVVSSGFSGLDFTATFQVFTAVMYAALRSLFTSGRTLWISSPFGECYYVRIGPTSSGGGSGSEVLHSTLQPSVATNPVRTLTVTGLDQPRPSV